MLKLIQIFLSISLLILTSCTHYKPIGEKVANEKSIYSSPYFNEIDGEFLFDAKMQVFGNDLNGILVIKTIDENKKRLALISDFGNTLLDFEFVNDEVNVIYIMDDLNKKLVIQMLENYFQLIIHPSFTIKKTYLAEEGKTYISKLQGKRIFLYVNKEDQLVYLKQSSIFRDKVGVYFYAKSTQIETIQFESFELPIKINLIKR
ncbi:hypothetical protein [Brumimicrobium aurantiacum]|uniref:DUF4292 domain-containing protein n=1 Tax=Brumimicrobium aurantiacum TaxID=1737063 RepID=A0A3E1EZC7_9FLAO|nr:hypothetical protein [Brumimicrobium aurantiacum]RFC54920.1 hypothetical protein DXU93_03605 [Brumimicrobium aurantiacum]